MRMRGDSRSTNCATRTRWPKKCDDFGGHRCRRRCHPDRRIDSRLDLWQDLRHNHALLRKQPGFAIAAVLMLALGIGANTAIFSVVNSVLIKPLPYPDPDALVNVVHEVNGADLAHLDRVYLARESNRTFERFGVWAASTSTVTGGGDPEQVRTLIVSHEVLPALGMRPVIGRWFSGDEGGGGTPPGCSSPAGSGNGASVVMRVFSSKPSRSTVVRIRSSA